MLPLSHQYPPHVSCSPQIQCNAGGSLTRSMSKVRKKVFSCTTDHHLPQRPRLSSNPLNPTHALSSTPQDSAHAQIGRATVYLCKVRSRHFFLLTGAITPSVVAVVGRTGWPLLAVPGYTRSGNGGHNWNLSCHFFPESISSPPPPLSLCDRGTSGSLLLPT